MKSNLFPSFILRIGLGIVFLIFGIGKFTGDIWAETIKAMPIFNSIPININTIVIIIGIMEVLTGLCLILGLFTRFFASLASLQLIMILILLKFGEVRDIGLLAAALSLAISGSRFLSIDNLRNKDE